MEDRICTQPRWVLGISLYGDTTYVSLTQAVKATAGLAAMSPQSSSMAGDATETLGQGRCLRRRMVVVGPPVAPSPAQAAAAVGASPCSRLEVKAVPAKCVDLPTPPFPICQSRLQCLKCTDFPVYPASAYLPKSNCVGFVFLSLYISEVKQRDVANGIILTHLCCCY